MGTTSTPGWGWWSDAAPVGAGRTVAVALAESVVVRPGAILTTLTHGSPLQKMDKTAPDPGRKPLLRKSRGMAKGRIGLKTMPIELI